MGIRQSFCYGLFRPEGMSLDELFAKAAEMGFGAVETWHRNDEFDEFVKAAQKNNLVIASIIGDFGIADGFNDIKNHDMLVEKTREIIDVAADLAIPGIICFSGNRREGQTDEQGLAITVEGLRRAAPYAEKKGVNLNLELLNSKVDHGGYMCDRTVWGVEVCERVNSPSVKLLYDIYHMQIMEGDVIRTIRDNIKWIGHFHTAGVPGRNEMDQTQELNYRPIAQAISDCGYEYYFGHELNPLGDKLDALRQAFDICNV